ncbi:MAG: hypothetical protein L0G21_07435 [Lactococcus raffinolactis]|nr:hypothetical protein [Lactococcus raffinolactis]
MKKFFKFFLLGFAIVCAVAVLSPVVTMLFVPLLLLLVLASACVGFYWLLTLVGLLGSRK